MNDEPDGEPQHDSDGADAQLPPDRDRAARPLIPPAILAEIARSGETFGQLRSGQIPGLAGALADLGRARASTDEARRSMGMNADFQKNLIKMAEDARRNEERSRASSMDALRATIAPAIKTKAEEIARQEAIARSSEENAESTRQLLVAIEAQGDAINKLVEHAATSGEEESRRHRVTVRLTVAVIVISVVAAVAAWIGVGQNAHDSNPAPTSHTATTKP